MQKATEQQVIQALDRLTFFANKQNPLEVITPFYHTAETLQKFGNSQLQLRKKQPYYQKFYEMFQKFSMRDFSSLKKHHQHILDEIVEIVQSKAFINCLRPDINQVRNLRHSLKKTKVDIIMLDTQEYDFFTGQITKTQSFCKSSTSESFKENINSVDQSSQKSEEIKLKSQILTEKLSLSKSKSEQLDNLYEQIKKSYQQHSIDDAYSKMQQYLSKILNQSQLSKQKTKYFKNISEEYETMVNFYSEFEKDQWIFDKQQNGITLEYKIYKDENMIAIRIQGEGEIPIQPFLAIICQIDLMGQYVPFCYDSKQMKKISRNQRIGSTKIYIPVLNDRQTFFYAAGYDRMKSNKSLFFFSKTINEDLHYQKKYNFPVPKQGKYVRLQYKFFIVEYIPLTKTKAKIRLASKVDMKMNYLPSFLLFKSARMFAFDYFKNILDRIKNFKGSAWESKVKQNPDMYRFFHQKIDQFII